MLPVGHVSVTCMIFVASFYLCACADADSRLPAPLTHAVTVCPANCSCVKTSLYCTVAETITSFPVVADADEAHSILEM